MLGIVGLQTDDTFFLADKEFAELEDSELKKAGFMAKEREILSLSHRLIFNRGQIVQDPQECGVQLIQKDQGKRLELVDKKDLLQYTAQRARGAYIATICQPEAAYALSVAAQCKNPQKDQAKLLNKTLQ